MTSITDLKRMEQSVDRAEMDYLRKVIADLPNARAYARWLETSRPAEARALVNARRGSSAAERGYLVVEEAMARPCVLLGLVGARTRIIGAFGMEVRRELLEGDDD